MLDFVSIDGEMSTTAYMDFAPGLLQHKHNPMFSGRGLAYEFTRKNQVSALCFKHELSAIIGRNAPLPKMWIRLASNYFLDCNEQQLKIKLYNYAQEL